MGAVKNGKQPTTPQLVVHKMSPDPMPQTPSHAPLVLASQSQIRLKILRDSGILVEAAPARVDEASVKSAMLDQGEPPRNIADALAELKARKIAQKSPERLVLGADQVLVRDGILFDKPDTVEQAHAQLLQLRNKSHELLSAAVIFADGQPVFRHIGRAKLTMRNFSDRFLEDYLGDQGDAVLHSVGAYKIEDIGVQMFSRIEGDYFSILGLPLLEVLDYLRVRGVLTQ